MNDKDLLIEQIYKSFQGVKRDGGVTLHQASVLDDYGTKNEFEAASALDTENRWEDVNPDYLETLHVFPFLDAKGFKYYLPAYMVWVLRNYSSSHSNTPNALIYALTPEGGGSDVREVMVDKYSLLSSQQKQLVSDFLRFCVENMIGSVDVVAAKNALEIYWDHAN